MPTGQSRCWRWARTVQPTPCLRKTRVTRSWPSPRHMETPLPCRGRNSLPSTAAHLPLPLWLSRACLPPMKCGPPQCHGNIPILLCLPCHACVCVCVLVMYVCVYMHLCVNYICSETWWHPFLQELPESEVVLKGALKWRNMMGLIHRNGLKTTRLRLTAVFQTI